MRVRITEVLFIENTVYGHFAGTVRNREVSVLEQVSVRRGVRNLKTVACVADGLNGAAHAFHHDILLHVPENVM